MCYKRFSMEITNLDIFFIYLIPGLFILFQSVIVYSVIHKNKPLELERMSIFNPIDFTLFVCVNTLSTFIILQNVSILVAGLLLPLLLTFAFFIHYMEGKIFIFQIFSIVYSIIVLVEYYMIFNHFFG